MHLKKKYNASDKALCKTYNYIDQIMLKGLIKRDCSLLKKGQLILPAKQINIHDIYGTSGTKMKRLF